MPFFLLFFFLSLAYSVIFHLPAISLFLLLCPFCVSLVGYFICLDVCLPLFTLLFSLGRTQPSTHRRNPEPGMKLAAL